MPEHNSDFDLDRALRQSRVVPDDQFTEEMRARLHKQLRGGKSVKASQNGHSQGGFSLFGLTLPTRKERIALPQSKLMPVFGMGFAALLVVALGAAVLLPQRPDHVAEVTLTPTTTAIAETGLAGTPTGTVNVTPTASFTPGGPTVTATSTTAGSVLPATTQAPGGTSVTATPAPQATMTPTPSVVATSGPGVPPAIYELTVSPTAGLAQGDLITVTWRAQGASAKVCLVSPNTYPGVCQFDQPVVGTTTFNIFHPVGKMYVELVVTGNVNDGSIPPEVTEHVELDLGCPTPWVFEALADDDRCPGAAVDFKGAAEPFERGWMIWNGATYYVLLNRPAPVSPNVNEMFIAYDPLSVTGDTSAQYTPPSGLFAPISGFGLLWRGDTANLPDPLVDALGWATQPEVVFEGTYQCAVYTHRLTTCYMIHPDGRLVALAQSLMGHSWKYYAGE